MLPTWGAVGRRPKVFFFDRTRSKIFCDFLVERVPNFFVICYKLLFVNQINNKILTKIIKKIVNRKKSYLKSCYLSRVYYSRFLAFK